ncbi:PREDICTED: uncharacterized protein LOC109182188 isoform X2 [Ipomoea nil]|uniref:uncharacterized protein LOC109182188 isoform X2 n=1 Tax=Ipomoea nil TaxID=35883 RepID=UPI000901C5DE|nr:PREDICTED: uncharacterized protein LOC109182188 isoform X2 [Ipomoea nil]
MIHTAVDTFYLTDEQLKNSPSRRYGIDEATERTLRIYGCDLIQESGILLKLPQAVMATGQVLFHRFYCKKSFSHFNVKIVAASCVWLASKLEHCPRKAGRVLIVFHRMECRRENLPIEHLDTSSKKYVDLKADLFKTKRSLQKEMGVICHVEHPHKFISIYLTILEMPHELRQEAWNLANDSLRTTLCVRFKSEVVACGVVYATARRFKVPLPENPPWWKAFDTDKTGIDEVCRVLAHLYSLPKAQYIHVCREGGSFSTSNRSWDLPSKPMPKVKNKRHRSCKPKKFSAASAAAWQRSFDNGSSLAERYIGMPNASQSTLQPTLKKVSQPKARGPTTCKKLKMMKLDEELSVEFDKHSRPIGQYGSEFKSYLGTLVRSHVDINLSGWRKVDKKIKNTIWEEIKREFNIPNDEKKHTVLRVAGMRWKDFKARLVRNFIYKKHPRYESPTQLYDFLTDAQWEKFVANRETEQFKEQSQLARERQSQNKHPHFLGSAGYAGRKSEWLISDPLSSQSSCASVNSIIASDDRSLDWIRARSKKGKDGNYYIPNEKTKEVFQKIVEKCEEVSQGSFQPKRHHDILSAATGKEDHSGFVRGVGVYVTIRDVFGKPEERKSRFADVENLREIIKKEVYTDIAEKVKQETISAMQPTIDILNDQLKYLMKNAPQQFPVDPSASTGTPLSTRIPFDPPLTRSNCHSVDLNSFSMIQENVIINSKEQNEEEMNEQSDEHDGLSTTKARPLLVDDDVLQHLGNECKQLVTLLKSVPPNLDYFELELEYAIFHHRNVPAIYVMMGDIKDLLTMKWLDVSIIQVFILCLNRLCKQNGVNSIGFMCPTQISKANVNLNIDVVTTYLAHVMLQLKSHKFILAPYHQEHHWLLLVISVNPKMVYVLDPIECDRTLEIKPALNMAFRSFTSQRGQRARNMVDWKKVRCPQQSGGVECGYYVMRYMYEMCTRYSDYTSLDEAFQEVNAYPNKEIDEIRTMWVKYFMEECI